MSAIDLVQRISVMPRQLFDLFTDNVVFESQEEHLWRELEAQSDIKCVRVPLDIARQFQNWSLAEVQLMFFWPAKGNYAIMVDKEDWKKSELCNRKRKMEANDGRKQLYATNARIDRILVMVGKFAAVLNLGKGWVHAISEGAYKAYSQEQENGLREYIAKLETLFAKVLNGTRLYEEPSGDELMPADPHLSPTPRITIINIETIETYDKPQEEETGPDQTDYNIQ
jgi:hypothetical protein